MLYYNIFIMNGNKRITLQEISRESGCSLAVVSRALSSNALQHRSVAPETAARVVAIARKLGWIPRRTVRSRRPIGVVGVFLPRSGSSLMLELLDSINENIRKYNTPVYCYSSADAGCFRQFCENHLTGNSNVGAVSYFPPAVDDVPAFMEMYEKFCRRDAPLVIVHNNAPDDFPAISVKVDNFYGGKLAGEHLLQCQCRRVFIFGQSRQKYRYERLLGCCEALNQHGIAYQTVVNIEEFKQEDLLSMLKQIEQSVDWRAPEPVGILADGMHAALTIHNYFQSKGVAIGGKLKIVCYDDSPLISSAYPALTAVRQPFASMGELAVKKLFNLMNGLSEKSALLKPELIIRQST